MTSGGQRPEVLDVGPRTSPAAHRRWGVLMLVLAVLLAGGLASHLTRPSDLAERRLAPSPTPTPSVPRTPPPVRPSTPPPTAPVTLRRSGPKLPGFDDGDLFLRSQDTVFRLRLRDGRLSATPAASGQSSPVGFLAGPQGVIVLPAGGPGLLIPDERPARPLRGALRPGSQVLPGPDGLVWVSSSPGGRSSGFVLTDLDGVWTGPTVRENGYFLADGQGGLLLSDVGGTYASQGRSWRRLTTGSVIATGPHHLLIATCDADHDCGTFRYDRRDRSTTRLALDETLELWEGGVVSPDGRYVVFTSYASAGSSVLLVLDLASGRRVARTVADEAYDTATAAVWSSDGRRLLALDQGHLVVVDIATGRVDRPELGLSDLAALTLRPAG
jgi:hypothetical protein